MLGRRSERNFLKLISEMISLLLYWNANIWCEKSNASLGNTKMSSRRAFWSACSWLNTKQTSEEMNGCGKIEKQLRHWKRLRSSRACLIIWKRVALESMPSQQLDVYFIGELLREKVSRFRMPTRATTQRKRGLINESLRRVATTITKCIATERHRREFKYLQCDPG